MRAREDASGKSCLNVCANPKPMRFNCVYMYMYSHKSAECITCETITALLQYYKCDHRVYIMTPTTLDCTSAQIKDSYGYR